MVDIENYSNNVDTDNEIIDDSYCAAYNPDGRVYIINKADLERIPKLTHDEILAAVERVKKYIKKEANNHES